MTEFCACNKTFLCFQCQGEGKYEETITFEYIKHNIKENIYKTYVVRCCYYCYSKEEDENKICPRCEIAIKNHTYEKAIECKLLQKPHECNNFK
jgi:hypothetical protein